MDRLPRPHLGLRHKNPGGAGLINEEYAMKALVLFFFLEPTSQACVILVWLKRMQAASPE